jgi:hypothetical protein
MQKIFLRIGWPVKGKCFFVWQSILQEKFSKQWTDLWTKAVKKTTLQRKSHLCTVFLFWELRGFSPSFHIHVFVGNLFPGSVHIFGYSKIDRPILEIYKSLTDTLYECWNGETEHSNSVSILGGNQTFILDSHQPFICSV